MPGITPLIKLLPFIGALSSGDDFMPRAYFWFVASTSGLSHARSNRAPIHGSAGASRSSQGGSPGSGPGVTVGQSNKDTKPGQSSQGSRHDHQQPEPDGLERRPQDSHHQIGRWPWAIAACDILSHIFLRYGPMSFRSLDPDRQSGEAVDRAALTSAEADPRSTSV